MYKYRYKNIQLCKHGSENIFIAHVSNKYYVYEHEQSITFGQKYIRKYVCDKYLLCYINEQLLQIVFNHLSALYKIL